jgi:hypothetical protein
MPNGRMTGELTGKGLEWNSYHLIKVISWNLPGRTVVNHKKSSVRIVGTLAEIWTEHFPEYKSRGLPLH